MNEEFLRIIQETLDATGIDYDTRKSYMGRGSLKPTTGIVIESLEDLITALVERIEEMEQRIEEMENADSDGPNGSYPKKLQSDHMGRRYILY